MVLVLSYCSVNLIRKIMMFFIFDKYIFWIFKLEAWFLKNWLSSSPIFLSFKTWLPSASLISETWLLLLEKNDLFFKIIYSQIPKLDSSCGKISFLSFSDCFILYRLAMCLWFSPPPELLKHKKRDLSNFFSSLKVCVFLTIIYIQTWKNVTHLIMETIWIKVFIIFVVYSLWFIFLIFLVYTTRIWNIFLMLELSHVVLEINSKIPLKFQNWNPWKIVFLVLFTCFKSRICPNY